MNNMTLRSITGDDNISKEKNKITYIIDIIDIIQQITSNSNLPNDFYQ